MRSLRPSFTAFATGLALVAGVAVFTAAAVDAQTYPPGNDARDGLAAGLTDAGSAANGMRLVALAPKPLPFDSVSGLTFVNSDLAFRGNYVYQGNFSGFSIWNVANPARPVLASAYPCVTSQGDPSIYGNLLFISAEGGGNRNDCAKGGVDDPSEHMAGVRIFDVSDPTNPSLVKNVQTCKGSHTHTLIPDPDDAGVVYIYVSGSGGAREEMEGCVAGDDPADENNSLYRLDVIRVPVAAPEQAAVVTGARIFTGLTPAQRRGGGRAGAGVGAEPTGPSTRNCHDVTAYPAMGLLAGACSRYGILVDVSDPENPRRMDAVSDSMFSLWHTAVFSNDGSKVVFTDEWGGGTSPNCQAIHMMEMGGNTVLTIGDDGDLTQHAYFKIPTAQTPQENCVSHNGGLIPVPGRDIMVQGWYQGGVDISDFTDPANPFEIAYFDRGPVDQPPTAEEEAGPRRRSTIGGSWGAYWYNGYIYSSEMARGLDVFELVPSEHLSANEIAAAKLVMMDEYNPQSQPLIEWPAAFPVVRSYLDQLVRGNGLAAARTTAIAAALDAAEAQSGAARSSALRTLAEQVRGDAAGAADADRVRAMADAMEALAGVR
jgi:hypothetical protein